MVSDFIKEMLDVVKKDKKRKTTIIVLILLVVIFNLVGIYHKFYLVVPVTIFALVFSISIVLVRNKKAQLFLPTWYRVVSYIAILYTGYFLVGSLVLNAPTVEPTATNIYKGKVIATAGAIERTLSGYEYLGRVDYKRVYISEAIREFTGSYALGETKYRQDGSEFVQKMKDSKNDMVLVFFKNNCPYCAGGFSGILEKYDSLSEYDRTEVVFVNLETEIGQYLSQEFELEKASTMLRFNSDDKTFEKASYSTDDKTPNKGAIDIIFSELYM